MSLILLSRLIDLPESDLQQVLDYAQTLSKPEATDHFKNLLGDSPQAIDFISAFNARRKDPTAPAPSQSQAPTRPGSDVDAVPKPQRAQKKKKAPPLHTPAPRQIANLGPAPGTTYNKKDLEDDYISGRSGASSPAQRPGSAKPPSAATVAAPPPKKPPSASGSLVSDLLPVPKQKSKSNSSSRSSTPGPASKGNNGATKVVITGGTPMQGASTALADLDAAIRQLEITTNPTLAGGSDADTAARRCNCVATRHPLQTAAPNCLNCGKVICLKEGLGPCTFCGAALLSPAEVQSMLRELKAERGKERMAADRQAHRKADVSTTPRPFSRPVRDEDKGPRPGEDPAMAAAAAKAREHRDKLLGFQAQNAQRTTVRDEASDFDVSLAGSMWASPEARAMELKKQQKLLREMEWNARPEYEKRKEVLSIDLVGGKVVKKMVAAERPPTPDAPEQPDYADAASSGALIETDGNRGAGSGAFSHNPLLQGLIKPVYDAKGKGAELEGRKDKKTRWRRVQDDLDDNEAVILDGGIYGGPLQAGGANRDEPECG